MKKRFAAVLAATAVLGVTTAFAANPFSDVEPSHWAYQSVAQLAAEGVINGYPDGTFKGQNNITRYEMAQMVAKAMANQDRVDAEQNAMINRLADEFSEELNNLGVRVSNLEKKVGNVKVSGDFRMVYEGRGNSGIVRNYLIGNVGQSQASTVEDSWSYRARLQFDAKVNDKTDVTVRVSTNDVEFGSSDATLEIERAYVAHRFGSKLRLEAGRTDLLIGNGLFYDDAMDGVKAVYGDEKLSLTAAYGEPHIAGAAAPGLEAVINTSDDAATYFDVRGKVSDVNLMAFYAKAHDGSPYFTELYGFGADATFNKIWVGAEWMKLDDKNPLHTSDTDAWMAGIGYGNYDQEKKGTWGVKAQYFNIGNYISLPSSAYNVSDNRNYKGWLATVEYAVLDNVGLGLYYGFAGETAGGTDYADYYRAEINYKF